MEQHNDGKVLLRMEGISKSFPGVQALDRVLDQHGGVPRTFERVAKLEDGEVKAQPAPHWCAIGSHLEQVARPRAR